MKRVRHLEYTEEIYRTEFPYSVVSTRIYDANLKIFMFEPKKLRALKLCMNHHLRDVYKFWTQDAPDLITGPVLVLKHLYVCIC